MNRNKTRHTKPIVWTIAGSDSGGGAGIQADLHTFQDLGVFGCSVITAMTAQNSLAVRAIQCASAEFVEQQIQALDDDLPAVALKLGMLANKSIIAQVSSFLMHYSGKVVLDPVMIASSGAPLLDGDAVDDLKNKIFKFVDILTPNLPEAELLLGYPIKSLPQMRQAAQDLLAFGVKSVLLKGGHLSAPDDADFVVDLWTDGKDEVLLRGARWNNPYHPDNYHGSGCTLSAALTALLARATPLPDALVLAKAYVSRAIRTAVCYSQQQHSPPPLNHGFTTGKSCDLPVIVPKQHMIKKKFECLFQGCNTLGFYPIVADSTWVARLLAQGIQTIQLRIKDVPADVRATEIQRACALAQQYGAKLFINDAWAEAITYGAYGVHLGQDDLVHADMSAIAHAGLRLGISTHNFEELARALFFAPSYIAFGPIYPTNTKAMPFGPRGLTFLKKIVQAVHCPVVAIGGIKYHHLSALNDCGVNGVAVISAIVGQADPETLARQYHEHWQKLLAARRPSHKPRRPY